MVTTPRRGDDERVRAHGTLAAHRSHRRVVRLRGLDGLGLWACGRCHAQFDASASWVEVSTDDDSATILCSACAGAIER